MTLTRVDAELADQDGKRKKAIVCGPRYLLSILHIIQLTPQCISFCVV